MSRKKKRKKSHYSDIELNIMPFIDVFSLLNTFLLMSAVFISIGVIEVQIPFLTNAPPPKDQPVRSLDIKIDMEKDKIVVTTEWSSPPENKQTEEFKVNKGEIDKLHKHLVGVRRQNPETDKVQLFTEDDVIWEDIAAVLDAIKSRRPGDPVFQPKGKDPQSLDNAEFLFPKVVMASVML